MPLSISQVMTSIGELQRDYLYKLVIESYPVSMNLTYPNSSVMKDMIDLYNTKGIFPNRKTDPIQLWWAGEFGHVSGRDSSTKNGDLTFRLSQDMGIKDFFEAGKDLTGSLRGHAAANKPLQLFNFGVFMIDVGKEKVTDYRGLRNVMILGIDNVTPDKEGSGIVAFTVNIAWDWVERNDRFRGQTI